MRTTGLDAEIGHHHLLYAWLMARHERRVGRRIIVGDAPVAGARASQMLRDRRFHDGLLLKLNRQAESLISLMTLASTGRVKCSTRLAREVLSSSRVTSGLE